jgi:hypothetical protein
VQNGTGDEPQSSTHPIRAYGTPNADYSVISGDRGSRRVSQLNTLPNGTRVIAAGMVTEIREHGPIDEPRATLILMNDLGQATYAAADAIVLAEYSMCLMDGAEVSLHGVARMPFREDPKTAYIQIVSVEPLVD